jgi:hypothetical protein
MACVNIVKPKKINLVNTDVIVNFRVIPLIGIVTTPSGNAVERQLPLPAQQQQR